MPKRLEGYTGKDKKGRPFCRFDYTDQFGKRKTIRRFTKTITDAKDLLDDLLRKYKQGGEATIEGERMTFNQLAEFYEKKYLTEPKYVDGRKVSGLRSAYDYKLRLDVLKAHFGKRKLKTIKHKDIEDFRALRLQTPTRHGTQRSIATVNRELSVLRRVLTIAVRRDWIAKNPFESGESLISIGDEKPKERVISKEEERRLLDACIGERAHLRAIVICAIDTGMRRGEITALKWADVDLTNRIITIQAFNTKTMTERHVAMTERLTKELEALYEVSTKDLNTLCFGIKEFKKSFTSARKIAGISDVRFHDLRHTHGTRLSASGFSLADVGRILGHRQPQTTYRYVNATADTLRRAATILDEMNQSVEEVEKTLIN